MQKRPSSERVLLGWLEPDAVPFGDGATGRRFQEWLTRWSAYDLFLNRQPSLQVQHARAVEKLNASFPDGDADKFRSLVRLGLP